MGFNARSWPSIRAFFLETPMGTRRRAKHRGTNAPPRARPATKIRTAPGLAGLSPARLQNIGVGKRRGK